MVVGMNSQNPSRTEYVIRQSLQKDFSSLRLRFLNLEEYLRCEGQLVTNEYVYNEKKKFKPDVVLYSGVEGLEPNTFFNYKGCKQIIWFYDAPFHVNVCKLGNLSDYLFITARGLVNDYKYWGVNCHWLLEGVYNPPHIFMSEKDENLISDIIFVGTPDIHRNKLLTEVNRRFPNSLTIWGASNGPPYFGLDNYGWDKSLTHTGKMINGEGYPLLCSSAKIVLGTNVYNDIYQYFSNRNLYTMACGGFLLTEYVPGMEELFKNHQHLVWYKDEQECIEMIDFYLGNPNKRAEIASEGCKFVFQEFSMTKQLVKMFNICGVTGWKIY